jgi:hypothetical protein
MPALALILAAVAAVPQVRQLRLPGGYALDTQNPAVRANDRGDVATAVHRKPDGPSGIYVWYADGSTRALPAPAVARGDISAALKLGAVGPDGEIYAAIVRTTEGARMVQSEDDVVYRGATATPFAPPCTRGAALPSFASADGALGLTYLADPNDISPDNFQDGSYAPYAALVRGTRCTLLGRAYVTALRGEYVAGYRGYLSATSHVLGPSIVDTDSQYYVAVRWFDLVASELGPGVVYDVASDGTCVGADGLPGAAAGTHATLWDPAGHARRFLTGDASSIAYAVDDRGRTAGTLVDAVTKRRYAFVSTTAGVRRLDELAADPRWHLEYAYRILADGRIVGTGTHEGIATLFELSY